MIGDYNCTEIEKRWQDLWLESGIYNWDPTKERKENFSIDTPPPTVSGTLHMGHVFSYTHADFLARFMRMSGMNVFYPMGFDDNGLPTERLVEKIKGVKAAQIPRHEFIIMCQEVVQEAEEEFRKLFKSIALSVDWSQEYQTISPLSRKLSQMSFIDLYSKDLVKRDLAPTFWDPVDRTAIAQAEIEDKEKPSLMNEILFTLEGSSESLCIATTRAEMIPACSAVLYNPEDERYKHLHGKSAIIPLFNRSVPIIQDADVAIDKGTGLVMCCTFGDIQDVQWYKKYSLTLHDCIELTGHMKNAEKYNGLTIKEARQQILTDLKEANLLGTQTEITHTVKCAERSGAPIEIILTSQWFIRVMEHKDALLQKAKECSWHPDYMKVRLENWINGLRQDWCISRQRYFGVPFPIWYSKRKGEEGKVLLPSIEQLPVDPLVDLPYGYSKDEIEPDTDVMDTWATSGITPQLNSHAIHEDLAVDLERHRKLFPFDIRPQAHEIIRTWAFATITKSLHHEDTIPWSHLTISGWCLTANKEKMSKSKGNIVTPTDLIHSKGADVVRYWAANAKLGTDIVYSEDMFKIGQKLITKLWNSAKFVLMHTKDTEHNSSDIKEALDVWICSKLSLTVTAAEKAWQKFDHAEALSITEDFFWNDFCDNYIELIKARIYDAENLNPVAKKSAIATIKYVMSTVLLLFAPFIPHATEELHQAINKLNKSIHSVGSWPVPGLCKEDAIAEGEAVKKLLTLIRKWKSEQNLSLKTELTSVIYNGLEFTISSSAINDLKMTANAKHLASGDDVVDKKSNPAAEGLTIQITK